MNRYIAGAAFALVVAVGVSVATFSNPDALEGTVVSDGDSTNPVTEQLASTDIQPGSASGDEDDTDVPNSDVQVEVEVDEEVLPDGVTHQSQEEAELQDRMLASSGVDPFAVSGDSFGDDITTDQTNEEDISTSPAEVPDVTPGAATWTLVEAIADPGLSLVAEAFLTIDTDVSPHLGWTGCNWLDGRRAATVEISGIEFPAAFIPTEMACSAEEGLQEDFIVNVLNNADSVSIDGDRLTITSAGQVLVYTAS